VIIALFLADRKDSFTPIEISCCGEVPFCFLVSGQTVFAKSARMRLQLGRRVVIIYSMPCLPNLSKTR
jgi:hypothetical protein